MEKEINWCEILGWGEEQLDDLRITGYSYIRQGKYDIALPFFTALVALEPSEPYHIQTLGGLYLQMGDSEKALETLDKALESDASHSPTQLNKAKALFELGRIAEGLILAQSLVNNEDQTISHTAQALIMAYR